MRGAARFVLAFWLAAAPPARAQEKLKTGNEARPVARLRLNAVIADLFLSKDGDHLFALDLSAGKVYKIDAETLKIEAQVDAVDNAVAMALKPKGDLLYVVGHGPPENGLSYDKEAGAVQAIRTSDLSVVSSFKIPHVPTDVEATDDGKLLASCTGMDQTLIVIDPALESVTNTLKLLEPYSFIGLTPDQTRLYGRGFRGPICEIVPLPKDWGTPLKEYRAMIDGQDVRSPTSRGFEFSPDGKFFFCDGGTVFRMTADKDTDLKVEAGKIDRFESAATAPGCATFFTATRRGVIIQYGFDGLKREKAFKAGGLIPRMVLDVKRKRLVAFVSPILKEADQNVVRDFVAGDLVAYALDPPQAAVPGPRIEVRVTTKDGSVIEGTTGMATFRLETPGIGGIEIKLEDIEMIGHDRDYWVVKTRDENSEVGTAAIESIDVTTKSGETRLKVEDVDTIRVLKPSENGSKAGAASGAPPDLKAIKTLDRKTHFTGLALSSDKKSIYALDADRATLLILDAKTFEKPREVALAPGARVISVAPGGKVLFAAGGKSVSVVDLGKGECRATFEIDDDLWGLFAASEETLYASTSDGVDVISIPERKVVSQKVAARLDVAMAGGTLRATPDGSWLYAAGRAIHPPGFGSATADYRVWCPPGEEALAFSPDGTYGVSGAGIVYRRAKCFVADLSVCAEVARHDACIFLPSRKKLWVFTSHGFVREYDAETFEPAASYRTGLRVLRAVVDEEAGAVYAFAHDDLLFPLVPGRLHTFKLP